MPGWNPGSCGPGDGHRSSRFSIVNWNTRDLVLRCLDSLAAATEGIPGEVIVVENGSVDGSPDALARRTDIVLLENDKESRIRRGCQSGVPAIVRRARAPTQLRRRPGPPALQSMIGFLDDHPTIAGVAPLYVYPDGSPQPFHFRFPTFSVTLANCSAIARRFVPGMTRRLREFQMLDDDFSHARPVPQPSASCLLLRRSVLSGDHIFDERYPIFFNDVQFARSLAARGLELWVTPEATVVHDGSASTRMLGRTGKQQYLGSTIRMLDRNRVPPESVAVSSRCLRAARSPLDPRSTEHHRRQAVVDGPFGRCRATPHATHCESGMTCRGRGRRSQWRTAVGRSSTARPGSCTRALRVAVRPGRVSCGGTPFVVRFLVSPVLPRGNRRAAA